MKTILVPTDFSAASMHAADYACRFAEAIHASVRLLHACVVPLPATDIPDVEISPDEIKAESDERLVKEMKRLENSFKVPVSYVSRVGHVADSITDEGEDAFIIVLGMEERGFLSETLFGGNISSTFRKTYKPVLVVPRHAAFKTPENIVFALDLNSKEDISSAGLLKFFALNFGSYIHVLHPYVSDENRNKWVDLKNKIQDMLGHDNTGFSFTETFHFEKEILEYAGKQDAGMIALISRQYSFWERIFHKDLSKSLAFHSRLPLLVLPGSLQDA